VEIKKIKPGLIHNCLKRSACLITFLFFLAIVSLGQERCGTVPYTQLMRRSGALVETDAQFEQWLNEKIQHRKQGKKEKRLQSIDHKIQVVVHIIHRGEPVGVGTNISDAQVNSQLQVLNKDFKRQNTDAANTPTEFMPVAGASDIEFVLAQTDPDGMPTNGINRVVGTKPDYTIDDDEALKAQSYWPAENYLNIWVCYLTDRFGYTQFPVSTLPGLENSSKNRLTDGVVISFEVFGSSDYGNFLLHPFYNKGRTTTHEVGHFFGLRHLWGDEANCKGDDYVNDTPSQASLTLGCPSHPQKECPSDDPQSKMFQNFLDYTDDECMNIFTQGQVDRMLTVLENSPRRASLLLPLSSTQPETQFPKLFSPNGDGVNDFWLWSNTLDYTGCKLSIFNRFGKPVYETTSYDNTWDGRTNNGQPLEEEAYYYVISCQNKKEITGAVRIVR
jgi:gliding motility-associated-like protein